MRFKGKKVLVYGLGVSGQEACRVLHEEGACVSLYDDDKRFSGMFCYEKEPIKKHFDQIIVSPGIKVRDNDIISYFKEKSEIISELDFGFSFIKGKIIAITGTNGKTTTCSLLGAIFNEAKKENFVCGNIGLPFCSVARKTTRKSITVVEVSNFQLELSKEFRPNVACILNITEDHLDRHGSMREYKRVKSLIFQKFKRRDIAIINLDDEECLTLNFPKRRKFVSKQELDRGVYIKNGYVFWNKKKIMLVSQIPLLGEKNLENVLCAIAVARCFKIKPVVIKNAIMKFKAPSHRLEFVGEIGGAKVYNDSKSTNVACTLMAIDSLNAQSLILMVGGRNKDNDFEKIFSKNFKAKKIIAFGESGEILGKYAEKYHYEAEVFEKMEDATRFAKEIAKEGDVILFSPACASFDEFASYSVRGQRFKEIILGKE